MRSKGNATSLMVCSRACLNAGRDELNQEPVSKKNPSRQPPEGDEHDQHNQGLYARFGINRM